MMPCNSLAEVGTREGAVETASYTSKGMKQNKPEGAKPEVKAPKQSYRQPELKKHGKLKNKATQYSTYTYTYIT